MGNPITYANLSDARSAEAIAAEFLLLRDAEASFFGHPAVKYGGSINGGASSVKSVPHYGLGGYDIMSATAEGTAATTQTLTTGVSSVTVARYALQREVGDLARMTDVNGVLDFAKFALDSYNSYVGTVVDLAANVIDGFTLTQTASAIMTLDDFAAAKQKIGAYSGPYLAILHPKQWGELEAELASTAAGAVAYTPATQQLIATMGPGFRGQLLGVDIFVTDRVISSGGDRKGAILAPGALVWADGVPPISDPAEEVLVDGRIKFSMDRQPSKGTALWVAEAYVGVSMGIDARGVTLGSDA